MNLPYINNSKIPDTFFRRDCLETAPDILGKYLVHRSKGINYAGIIVEVEAYRGNDDPASHAFGGMKNRNKIMFLSGGCFYIYFTYGAHFCCNIVTGMEGEGQAVLIRAVEPTDGIYQMGVNRFGIEQISDKQIISLANGPGKLCKAFGINKSHNGISCSGTELFLKEGMNIPGSQITRTERIGISRGLELQWRFFISGNKFLSRKI